MQAYEFYTMSENGIIRIPDEYKNKIGRRRKLKVVISEDKPPVIKKQSESKITWEEFQKYRGIVRSDIDEKLELEESRRERYENYD